MPGGTYIPVSGVTDSSDGHLLALDGLVSNPKLLVPPSASSPFASTSVQITYTSVTAELMASAGFPGLAVSGQSNVVYWIADIAATESIGGVAGSPVGTWVFGVGIRLAVRGISVSGSATASLGNLAASSSLNATSTSFEFDTIGLGFPVLPLLKGLIDQSLTGFGVNTIQELGNVLAGLTEFMADPDNAASLQPQVLGVIFSTANVSAAPGVQNAAATYGYSLRGIQQGLSNQQLSQKPAKNLPSGVSIDATILSAVYDEIVGGSSTTVPTSAQKNLAKQLVGSGP